MKPCVVVAVWLNPFITWTLRTVSDQSHSTAALPPGEKVLSIPWVGGLVAPRAGLDGETMRKYLPLPAIKFGRPVFQPVA